MVDDFGIKYVGEEHRDHLLNILNKYYEMETDYNGELYCGMTFEWNHEKGYMGISMPNYIQKNLVKYGHKKPRKPQHYPYEPAPKKYRKESNEITEEPESPRVNNEKKKYVQQVVGSFKYYARAVDLTTQQALSAIAEEQCNPTEKTLGGVSQFLD